MPRVSVILPTHNRSTLVRRAIESVLGQTYEDFELIVVDDASKDDTQAELAKVRDARVVRLKTEKPVGAAAARNLAASHACGELLAFLDDDDFWLVEKLRLQVASLDAAPPEVGLSICGYYADFGDHQRLICGERAFSSMDFRNGPTHGFALIATPGWLLKREAFVRAGGFNESMRSWDDWELAYRLSKICGFAHLAQPLYVQNRVTGGGMWNNRRVWGSDMNIILQNHGRDWEPDPAILARHHRLAAVSNILHGQGSDVRAHLLKAIRYYPVDIKSWVLLIFGIFGNAPVRGLLEARHGLQKMMQAVFFKRRHTGSKESISTK